MATRLNRGKLSPVNTIKKDFTNMESNDIPNIDQHGNILIPFNIDQKYHFWNGGHKLSETLEELNVPKEVWTNYVKKPHPGDAARAVDAG